MEQTNWESALEAILFALGEPGGGGTPGPGPGLYAPRGGGGLPGPGPARYVQTDAGLRLLRMEHRWQMVSAPQYGERIQTLLARKKPDKLSPAALETLALVAYFQPVTRAYLDQAGGWTVPTPWPCCWTGSWWPPAATWTPRGTRCSIRPPRPSSGCLG